jgi:hypothetical protein
MLHNSRDHFDPNGTCIRGRSRFLFLHGSKLNAANYYARIAFEYFD